MNLLVSIAIGIAAVLCIGIAACMVAWLASQATETFGEWAGAVVILIAAGAALGTAAWMLADLIPKLAEAVR